MDGGRKLKVGYFVTELRGMPGYEDVVSGHLQLPLHSIKLLIAAGHSVQLLTNELGDGLTLPTCMPEGVAIHPVVDSRRRRRHPKGIRLLKFIRQTRQIKSIVEEEQYDLLHLFGGHRMVLSIGLLRLFGVRVPLVLTFNFGSFPGPLWFLTKLLWRRPLVITSAEHVKKILRNKNIAAKVIKHGIVRNIDSGTDTIETQRRHRVLFWRDPSLQNGADICLKVYDALADRFPDISFDLAIRPHPDPVSGIQELSERHQNVHVFRFPYEDGISLPILLRESICVLLPFRELSIHPQFAVLESMFAGLAVITTYCESNEELITSGQDGILVSIGDVGATMGALKGILNEPEKARQMGKQAARSIRCRYGWNNYIKELTDSYKEMIRGRRGT